MSALTNYNLTVEARDTHSVEVATDAATRMVTGDPALLVTGDVDGDEVDFRLYVTRLARTEQELVEFLELLLTMMREGEDITDAQ